MKRGITISITLAAVSIAFAATLPIIPVEKINGFYNTKFIIQRAARSESKIPEVASGTYFLNTVDESINKGIACEIINNGENSYTIKHFAFQSFHDLPASVVFCERPGVETYTLSIPSGTPCCTIDGKEFGIYMGVPNQQTGKWNIYDNAIDFIVDGDNMTYIFAPYGGTIMYYAEGVGGIKIADLVNGLLASNGSMSTLELRDDTVDPSEPVTYPLRGEYINESKELMVYGLCGFTPRVTFNVNETDNTVEAIDQLVSWAIMPPDDEYGLPEETFPCYATDYGLDEGSYILTGILGSDAETGNATVFLPGPWGDVCEAGSLSAFEESSLKFNFKINEAGDICNPTADNNSSKPIEYFNLQGIKVENPANGIFIRRQGSSTSKIIIK